LGLAGTKPPQSEQAAEKVFYSVILSGAKNLSFFVFLLLDRRAILRSAQNDKNGEFFATFEARATNTQSIL
jgi:hypothetical protein